MTYEIRDSHFPTGDECRIAGEEPDNDKQAENYFNDPRHTEQRTERNRLAAEPAGDFLPAVRHEQQSDDDPHNGVGI